MKQYYSLMMKNPSVEVCGEILSTLGYNVLQARNGKDALKIYESNKGRIDLVILDMIMPGLSGGETFDALKTNGSGSQSNAFQRVYRQ